MRLHAICEIDFDAAVPVAAILMLRPRSGAAQWISHERYALTPQMPVIEFTDLFGNLCQRLVVPAGGAKLRAQCIADVADTVDIDHEATFVLPQFLPESVLPFTFASRYCPSDQLIKLALEVTDGVTPGYPQVDAIRTWINRNVEYKYGTSSAVTTAIDTAKMRQGVCRDFAHLGIALCRAINIPARMVAGYTLDLDEPDLHAWFEAFVGGRWFVFDAVQDQGTTGNRLAIAYGRDATDVALVTQFGPLNLQNLKVSVSAARE